MIQLDKKEKGKLPFAIFIDLNNKGIEENKDYKEIFTNIISNRIRQE